MATPLPPEVLPPDYEALGGIGGLLTPGEGYIPNIQSAYSSILQNAPEYQYFTSPLSNQGNTTASYGTTNQLVVAPDTPVRLVNNATGEVVSSGIGYEGAQAAIDAANALSSSTGSKANWDIQVVRPGGQTFESVSTERPDVSALGIAADVALPIAGSLLAGPLGLGALGLGAAGTGAVGAALGSGLSSAAQGRSLEDSLLRAAIAGGGSYLGSQLFAPGATTPTATGSVNADLVPNALKDLSFGGVTSTAVPSAVGNAASDIVVNAIRGATPSLFGSIAGSALGALPSMVNSYGYNPAEDINVTAQTQTQAPVTPPIVVPPTTTPVTPINPAEDINVTAKKTPTSSELAALSALGLGAGAILGGGTGGGTATTTTTAGSSGGTGTGGTTAAGSGVLGTGLSVSDLATLTSLGIGGLSSLFGGSGTGTTATTPYVSPFGALGSGMAGMDYRINPNISDYEKYGFGPEASFFRPEYSRLASMGAATPTTSTTAAPTYTPLI